MLRHRTNNNFTYAILATRILSFQIHTTSEKNIQTVQEKYITKETAHHRMLLPQSEPSLTDGAEIVSFLILCCPHKDHSPVIKPSTTNAEEVSFQELWITLKFMDSLIKHASPTVPTLLLHNNAKKKPLHAKSIKLLIIVSQRIWKT